MGAAKLIPSSSGQLMLFVMVFFNSGIVGGAASNPFGIKGVSEFFELLYLLFACAYLWGQFNAKGTVHKLDITIFAIVVSAILYSAIAAKMRFGQPIYYGLLEQRRLLIILIYFPLAWGFRHQVVSVTQIMGWVIATALLCGILSVLVASGLVEPLNVREAGENVLREDRYGIGKFYLLMGALALLFRMSLEKQHRYVFPFFFLLAVLIVIVQTRQLLIAFLISSFFMLGTVRILAWSLASVVGVAIVASTTNFLSALLAKYQILFLQLGAEEYLEAGARARTISAITDEIASGQWLGSGALSSKWNDGFARVYDANFFLSDVGIFGTAYVFGLFSIVLYGAYLYWQYRLVRASRAHPYYRLIVAVWIFLLVIMPVGATLEYRGTASGLLLALSLGCMLEVSRGRRLVKL